ncbi:NAD-binding protein [Clostridia bacterium]|nr:NAD-binding protein [Clostridia bacterium]
MDNRRKLLRIISLFFLVIVISVLGYKVLLDISLIDALYMTAITISTVGYGEVAEMTVLSKLFTIGIIFSGLSIVAYGFSSIVTTFFEGEFQVAWRRKKMLKKISELKDHYIVCGAGEVGQIVIEEFRLKGLDFVVIEKNEDRSRELIEENVLVVKDDATNEDALIRAKIMEAKSIVCTLANDADNVFTVLTARQINPRIYIISKAIEKGAHGKLLRAGANNTISPNEIGGRRIAAMVIRPTIKSFLDIITQIDEVSLDMEEVTICAGSELAGKTLGENRIPERSGLIVLAIRKLGEQRLRFNPNYETTLHEGDIMMVLGRSTQVDSLRSMACENIQ